MRFTICSRPSQEWMAKVEERLDGLAEQVADGQKHFHQYDERLTQGENAMHQLQLDSGVHGMAQRAQEGRLKRLENR